MNDFKREKHDPIAMIKRFWPYANTDHIEFDPNMVDSDRDFWRIEQTGHDGTLIFTYEMMQKALVRLVNMNSFCVARPPNTNKKLIGIKYKIGFIKHASVYGTILLKCSPNKMPGMRERVRIPVKCEYVYEGI